MSEEQQSGGAPPPPPKSKLVPVLLLVNTLLVGGGIAFVMRGPHAPGATAAGEKAKAEGAAEHSGGGEGESAGGEGHGGEGAVGVEVKLEPFVIQLRAIEAEKYVRLAFDLEVGSEADRNAMNARMSRIRDAVIGELSDHTVEDLRGSEGLAKTKAAIAKRIEEVLPGRHVKGVYLTDFVIQ